MTFNIFNGLVVLFLALHLLLARLPDLPVGADDAIGVPGDLCSEKRLAGFPSDRELDMFVPDVSFKGSNEFVQGACG